MPDPAHAWRFSRLGGSDQARVESAADYAHLDDLDPTLWAALACPVKGLDIDERTLALVDTDGDGRIRVPEVRAAVRWAREHLSDPATLREGRDGLRLAEIADRTDAGRALRASARRILEERGGPADGPLLVADAEAAAGVIAKSLRNGDGVVPPSAIRDPEVRRAAADILACMGGAPDRGGEPGLDRATLDAFFSQARALHDWAARAEGDAGLRPLGAGTDAAADAWRAVRAKVDDFFARCRLAAYDPRAVAALNRREEEYLAIAAADLDVTAAEVKGFPLARVEPGRALPLVEGLNPAWEGALARFRETAVEPLLGAGKASLAEAEWRDLGARFGAHEAWLGARPATPVETLGLARYREILEGPARAALEAILAEDLAADAEFRAVGEVERLLRYHRDLDRLLRNFVNFSEFYSRRRPAAFQAGVLYLDGRACELAVRVDDPGRHVALAGLARACLVYCDCTRPSGERMAIAAAFTDGDSDNLMVGRNGVFFDRRGRDWDATVTRMVDNPISVRQAFWAPYKKLVRMIEEQVAKRAATADAATDARLAGAAAEAAHAGRAAPPAPPPRKIDVGTVAALGVAVGAIGTLLAQLAASASGLLQALPFWKLCLAVGGILVAVSTPSMFIAWLKLRQRNLGPILDACGWAVNGRMRVNVRLGASLTRVATPPPGGTRSPDPFAERPGLLPRLLLLALLVAFLASLLDSHGLLYRWTAGSLGTPPAGSLPAAPPPPAAPR